MTIRLLPVAERDAALRDYLETTFWFDHATGELWMPTTPPPDLTPDDVDVQLLLGRR